MLIQQSRQAMEKWVNGLRDAKEFWIQHHKRLEFTQKRSTGTHIVEPMTVHNEADNLVSIHRVNFFFNPLVGAHRVHSFGVIWIRISDPRSWCIKGANESTLVMDSSVPLMYHNLIDLGSLIQIQITPKEWTHSLLCRPSLGSSC